MSSIPHPDKSAQAATKTYALALRFAAVGYSVCPIARNGTKRAAVEWKQLQSQFPSAAMLGEWFDRPDPYGIALVHGAISGNSEVIDIDLAEIADDFYATASREIPALIDAPWIKTPRPGYQLYYRNVVPPPGNLKLAEQLNPEWSEGATKVPKWKTKIETRGEGGYTITIGSPPSCHPANRRYRLAAGSFHTVPTLTTEKRALLHDIARVYDERPPDDDRDHRNLPDEAARLTSGGDRPGDDFNRSANWKALLEPHGWQCLHHAGAVGYWRRPGKKEPGASATTNYGSYGLLYIFSSNAYPFESARAYTKFAAFTLLEHGGDFRRAAQELCRWRARR